MSGDDDGGTADPRQLIGERLGQYTELWQSASAKLSRGDYHAEDLVDDWFRWVGMVARDSTAAATLICGGCPGTGAGPAAGAGDEPGD